MHALIEARRAELLSLASRRGVTGVRVSGSMSRDRDTRAPRNPATSSANRSGIWSGSGTIPPSISTSTSTSTSTTRAPAMASATRRACGQACGGRAGQ